MTYAYTTSVGALQRSVSYSCYNSKSWLLDIAVTIQLLLIISCYRARIALHNLGVVRQSIKVLAPTRQPLGLTLKQMCLFYKICFPFFVSKFLVRIVPLVKWLPRLDFDWSWNIDILSATFFFVSQGWWWWDKDNVLCSSFCKFLLKPKCKELCSSSHSCFNRVPFTQKIETFHPVVQFYTLSTYTIEFIAGVGSKTRWLKILRNLSFAPISEFSFLVSQFSRLELFLITFVRVANLNSVLACLQQIKEMWVNCVGVPLKSSSGELSSL